MNITSGFKRNKPRQFSYKPMYYDPDQEERDNKSAKYKGVDEYKPGSIVKNMRMERYKAGSDVNNKKIAADARNRTIIRLMIFLCLLVSIGYAIMNSTLLEKMFTVFKMK